MVRLEEFEQELTKQHWANAGRIEAVVNEKFAGQQFETRDGAVKVIMYINELVRWNAMAIICPKCDTKCQLNVATPPKGRKSSPIQYMHSVKGNTQRHGGRTVIEKLRIVPLVALGPDDKLELQEQKSDVPTEETLEEVLDASVKETPKKTTKKKPAKKKAKKKPKTRDK